VTQATLRCFNIELEMPLNDLLTPSSVLASLRVNGKKQALQEISERAAEVSGLPAREIFDAVLQRERLGPTGVGDGIAIPHGKIAKCGRIFGVFARLERPIDFEALDGLPVDLIFLLIAPESAGADHLKALAMIARVLRKTSVAAQIRATRDASGIYSVLTLTPTSNAA
jgi:PTS system nitrogen regulatory IIA component